MPRKKKIVERIESESSYRKRLTFIYGSDRLIEDGREYSCEANLILKLFPYTPDSYVVLLEDGISLFNRFIERFIHDLSGQRLIQFYDSGVMKIHDKETLWNKTTTQLNPLDGLFQFLHSSKSYQVEIYLFRYENYASSKISQVENYACEYDMKTYSFVKKRLDVE